MSEHTSENRALFAKALREVLDRKMEAEMEGCEEDASSTLRHKIIMRKIAKGKCTDREDIVRIRKRGILIAIIAAMLALTSCALAIVYREKIGGFIENIFEDFVEVSPESESDGTDGYPQKIEKVYEFTYIPEGYELKSKETYYFSVVYIYENAEGKELRVKQQLINTTENKINSEDSYRKIFDVKDITVYCRQDVFNTYVWQTSDYMFQIRCEEDLLEEEIEKIILRIK